MDTKAKIHVETTITLMVKWMNGNNIKKDSIVTLLFNEEYKQYTLVYYE